MTCFFKNSSSKLKWRLRTDFKSFSEMVFTNVFQMPWVMISSKQFHIQTSFSESDFELIDLFSKVYDVGIIIFEKLL